MGDDLGPLARTLFREHLDEHADYKSAIRAAYDRAEFSKSIIRLIKGKELRERAVRGGNSLLLRPIIMCGMVLFKNGLWSVLVLARGHARSLATPARVLVQTCTFYNPGTKNSLRSPF